MTSGHVVTIQAFVKSDSPDDARDSVGEMIRPCESVQGGSIVDWCFTGDCIPLGITDSIAAKEGEVWTMLDRYREQKQPLVDRVSPTKRELYDALKEFIDFSCCRQSNAAERKFLAERFETLGNKFRHLLRVDDRRGM